MPAEIIPFRPRSRPVRLVQPGEPAVVLIAAVAWVNAWWLVCGIAAARAIGRL